MNMPPTIVKTFRSGRRYGTISVGEGLNHELTIYRNMLKTPMNRLNLFHTFTLINCLFFSI
jgi:hypothetical protein